MNSFWDQVEQKAREEGRAEARAEAREKAREEGRAEGREEANQEIAINLHAIGMSEDVIAKVLRVSVETVNHWLEQTPAQGSPNFRLNQADRQSVIV